MKEQDLLLNRGRQRFRYPFFIVKGHTSYRSGNLDQIFCLHQSVTAKEGFHAPFFLCEKTDALRFLYSDKTTLVHGFFLLQADTPACGATSISHPRCLSRHWRRQRVTYDLRPGHYPFFKNPDK